MINVTASRFDTIRSLLSAGEIAKRHPELGRAVEALATKRDDEIEPAINVILRDHRRPIALVYEKLDRETAPPS